jgi:hypothetical protein
MMTFDNILPVLTNIFLAFKDDIATMRPVLVNRDLNWSDTAYYRRKVGRF